MHHHGFMGHHHGHMHGYESCTPKQKMLMAMVLFIMLGFINFIIAGIIHLKAHMME